MPQRVDEIAPVGDEGHHGAHRGQPQQRQPPAQAGNRDHEQVAQLVGQRHQQQGIGVGVDPGVVHFLVALAKGLDHRLVAAEGLDHPLAADGLLHHPIEVAQTTLQVAEAAAGVAGDEIGEPEHDRHHHHRRQRQPVVQQEHGHQDAGQRQHAGQQHHHVQRDGGVDGFDIVGQAAHQLAGGIGVEEAQRQRLQVAEQVAAQRLERPLRDTRHQPARHGVGQVARQVDGQHRDGENRQLRRVFGADGVVDGPAHQVGSQQPQAGRENQQHQHDHQNDLIRSEIRQQPDQRLARGLRFLDLARHGRAARHHTRAVAAVAAAGLVRHAGWLPLNPSPSCDA